MRTSLLHPLREPRGRRRPRHGRGRAGALESLRRARAERVTHVASSRSEAPPVLAHPDPAPDADPAVARVRGAGGPTDRAAYTCECGYCFSAAVSTTVSCPHCGAGQAW